MKRLALFVFAALALNAQDFTRGVGVYPGKQEQHNGALMVLDTVTYRNLALHRPAYASSSYDYNLTAQLVTDGIRETQLPVWFLASSSEEGMLPKNRREHLVDGNPISTVALPGTGGWVQFGVEGRDSPAEVDRIEVSAKPWAKELQPQQWTCVALSSDDGEKWTELGRASDTQILFSANWGLRAEIKPSFVLSSVTRSRYYRVRIDAPHVEKWEVGEVTLFRNNKPLMIGGPFSFTSAWKSAGSGEEWVYVDLGAECGFDRVKLYWIERATEMQLQFSQDAKTWETIETLQAAPGATDEWKLKEPKHGRYVRVVMTRPASPAGYVLSELEVYGRGGPVPHAARGAQLKAAAKMDLGGGAWRLQRDSQVTANGGEISKPGYADKDWLPATVPGTVLSSYFDDGAVPDPNYGQNQLMISDSYFWADFWYRDEFVMPATAGGRHIWMNFEGINWKADVFFNGKKLGQIEGGFMRRKFDVTSLVHRKGKNAIAVLVRKNANPGAVKEKTLAETDVNGGVLGADNPTYHASIGWDWIPTMRGRNTGIWGDLYLTNTGPVTIEKPFVSSTLPLPDSRRADVSVEVTLRNHEQKEVSGTVRGRFGSVEFQKQVTLAASTDLVVKFDPSTAPALRLQNPKLWWPAGYGEPNLYDVKLSFAVGKRAVSDSKSFRTGVRQFTYSEEGGALKIFINGRRLVPRGGNWGFSESMLRYRAREYDAAVRYHREMNFTMIRNWVGQIGDEAFYEACDKYGIVVWQDFWLANPFDGPDPDDNELFLRNANDFVERIRNHPSIGVYCGRNEGNPPKLLDDGLRRLIAELHPGLHYFPNSASGVVSGGGPYSAKPARFYFEQRATEKLHSELGMPNIVSMDSLKQMMPEADIWPQDDDWGMHDFTLTGAQNGDSYRRLIEKSYGAAKSANDWVEFAQFENYEGYRAMFEAQSKNRMGVLLWMSHPAWPDFVWQTYDYYFEPTAGYFASKKGCEPLHIQWNAATDDVEVVNYSSGVAKGLTAQAEILNADGSVQWQKSAPVDTAEDSVVRPMAITFPSNLTAVHFIRLKLTRGSELISENFYWRGIEEGNYQALTELPKVKLSAKTEVVAQGSQWVLTTKLKNISNSPALMVHVKGVRSKSGDRILPAIYSDNYVALMPGEERSIRTEVANADTRGERPNIAIDGFHLENVE